MDMMTMVRMEMDPCTAMDDDEYKRVRVLQHKAGCD